MRGEYSENDGGYSSGGGGGVSVVKFFYLMMMVGDFGCYLWVWGKVWMVCVFRGVVEVLVVVLRRI